MSSLRALSITRPWSELILRHGKNIENRSWGTGHRGPLLVHGAKSWQGAAVDYAENLGIDGLSWQKADYPTGIVGLVDVVGLCSLSVGGNPCDCGKWAAHGQCHWRLADPRPLPEPVPCNGALGLWTPTPDVMAAVLAQGVAV